MRQMPRFYAGSLAKLPISNDGFVPSQCIFRGMDDYAPSSLSFGSIALAWR